MRITTVMEIKIPRIVNFIRYGDGEEKYIDIAHLSDEDLKRIGEEWTKNLIDAAKRRRYENKHGSIK